MKPTDRPLTDHVTVLVIDPVADSRQRVRRWLRDAQYHVAVASSHAEALQALSVGAPALIILGRNSPGFDALRLFRRLDTTATVLMVVGHDDVSAHERARELRVRHLLAEGFGQDELLRMVEKILASTGTATPFHSLWERYATVETVSKETTDRIAAIETKFRTLFDHSADALFLLDLEGTILDVNARGCARLGYETTELLGQNISMIEERAEEDYQSARDSLEPDRVSVHSAFHVHRDGHRIPVEVRTSIIIMDGQPGVLASTTDVTKRRALEAQMRQFQKMEAVSRLAGGIAHDFNNALTVILTHAEFVLEEIERDSALRKDVEQIKAAAQRLGTWTRQLLAFSPDPHHESDILDCNTVVREVGSVLERVAGEDITLELKLDPSPCYVNSSKGRLTEILLALVDNARDAMSRGGVLSVQTGHITIAAKQGDQDLGLKPGEYVTVCVKDTGSGMDAETVSHVFEPFFTKKAEGSGMGLAVVYGMVTHSGGSVHVDSTPGQGTAVTLHMPASSAPEEKAPRATPAAPADLSGTETILLVEDDEQIRLLAERVLSRLGYRVLTAQDAMQALVVYNRFRSKIDLLVTDVVMPNMSGGELARRLEALGAELKVLYMTGYTGNALVESGIAEDHPALLRKPFTPGPFALMVRQVLDSPAPGSAERKARRLRVFVIDDDNAIRRSLRRILRDHDLVEASTIDEAKKLIALDQRFDVVLCDVGLGDASGLDLHRWLTRSAPGLAARVVFLTGGLQSPGDRAYVREAKIRTLEKPFDIDELQTTLRFVAERARARSTLRA